MAEMATIKVNSRTLGIHVATGAMMDARKWAITEISGGGGGSAREVHEECLHVAWPDRQPSPGCGFGCLAGRPAQPATDGHADTP